MKKEVPICTVLLIACNHAPYIRKSIDSVLSQNTKYPFIIKIFDNASTDGTSDIIKEYASKYPELIEANISGEKMTEQDNIWLAYKSVDTKYCIVTEADYYWSDNNKLQIQIKALEEHQECSFCVHKTDISKTTKEKTIRKNNEISLKNKAVISLNDVCSSTDIPHLSSRMIRMTAVDLDKLSEKESFVSDVCQFYYLLLQGKMIYLDRFMSAEATFDKDSSVIKKEKITVSILGLPLFKIKEKNNKKKVYFLGIPILKIVG